MVDSSVNQSGRYKAYPEYKHSGVEWLGEIPSSWGVSVMKWCILNNDGGVWGNDPTGENDTIVLRSTEQTVDGKWKIDNPALRKLTPKEKRSAFLKENDLLLTKSSGSSAHIGKTTLVDKKIAELECCYSNFMQRLRVNNSLNPKLVWYLLNNSLIREQFDYLSSTTTGLANLNASIIAETILPICSRKEQNKVVDFLDYETAKIDTLIEKQQRLIELLTEKRQAVISHAVTKGLNPNVPMKDSGVEWLGKVPEHWEVKRLKYLCKISTGTKDTVNAVEDGKYPFFVRSQTVERINSYSADCEAVLTAGDGVGVGKVYHYINGKFDYHQRVYMLSEFNQIAGRFLYYYLSSNFYKVALQGNAKSTVDSLRLPQFLNFEFSLPPMEEQSLIVSHLESHTTKIDGLIKMAQKQIQLMQERRTALISAAVTGKIDVRDWVKPE